MEYNFREIEPRQRAKWDEMDIYKVVEDTSLPKYYVLDMFPYPSGAGLHVGHPLGYIASDIFSRYKRMQGFNVLHPMGFDAFGLPAEQYAIETGQHPARTTEQNIKRYKEQFLKIGFSYDWSREVITADPSYYKWTQWIFMQLFSACFDVKQEKARAISSLIEYFEEHGYAGCNAFCDEAYDFSAAEWKAMSSDQQQAVLMDHRLAYLAYSDVNWCEALGTVLANDEVKDGFSERGGHPVVKKKMRQWFLRISAYAERLLQGLDTIDWPDSMKEIQKNWIGRSEGASVVFKTAKGGHEIEIFTTRPDTIFGATFMVLAPEHELVAKIATDSQKEGIKEYLAYVQSRSERDRMTEVKVVTGEFTGAFAINPFTNEEIPIWISEYVLAGYGTGAIMAVPSDDDRDFAFAQKFGLNVVEVIDKSEFPGAGRHDKLGKMINSGFLTGMQVPDAISKMIEAIEERSLGTGKVNYKMRDAGFSRQRYWGEPFPIAYQGDTATLLDESDLPLLLPDVDSFKPGSNGQSPLARSTDWLDLGDGRKRETDTMPGYAGSSWYFLRYMDPHNEAAFLDPAKEQYWQNVDLYLGGAEHGTGHLLYARMWHKFLHDMGFVSTDEPFKKLINQGMIQGRSSLVYRINGTNTFVSSGLKDDYETTALHVDLGLVRNDILNIDAFRNWRQEYKDAEFVLEDGAYHCGVEIEKMSKRWFNVVNPDDIVEEYGADTLRLYEMFLGPIDQAKPWDMNGIDGVHRFLKKLWRLFYQREELIVNDDDASQEELKILHKTIKKVTEDIERLSFNTAISAMMVCVNELGSLSCYKKAILNPLLRLIAPFAPHLADELWERLGFEGSIIIHNYPEHDEKYLEEKTYTYPVSVNGKLRAKIELPLELNKAEVEKEVLAMEAVQRWLEGKQPRKVIVVPGRIVNVVV